MFKKKIKKEEDLSHVTKEFYSVAIIDYLRNDAPTKVGVQALILTLFEKNYLTIEQKIVNLGTPWAPNEQEIVQLGLSNTIDPDKLTIIEDQMIKWLIFTFGDGIYTNLTQVLQDVNKKEFIDANIEMFNNYKDVVCSVAKRLNLIGTAYGKKQKAYYLEEEVSDENSKRLVYNQPYDVSSLIQMLLDLFDQSL